ncbi:hypothetical protein [Methylomonas sp. CM2]|uniref:hypothetical protein n=1 Tax=Methylomonas sp. CM2 TaxID=3417647 RepID=UPI003CF6EF61
MLLIPIAGYSSNIITNGPLLIAVSCGLAYVVIPVFLLCLWPAQKAKQSKSMQDALYDGDLLTVEHEVQDVVQIEEIEDEGLHFLLAIETGDTLSLSGQYLYGPVERNEFPSRRVRLFTNKTTGLLYGIEPIGERIPHWALYDSFTDEAPNSDLTIEDGKLYSQPIAEIVSQCRWQLATQPTPHDGSAK